MSTKKKQKSGHNSRDFWLITGFYRGISSDLLDTCSNDDNITKIIITTMNYYYKYKCKWSERYKSNHINLFDNNLSFKGCGSIRGDNELPVGKISIFQFNIFLEDIKAKKRLSECFFGITSNLNDNIYIGNEYKKLIYNNLPNFGEYFDIYCISAEEKRIIYGSKQQSIKKSFHKYSLINNYNNTIKLIFNYTNNKFIYLDFYVNGKHLRDKNSKNTMIIQINDSNKKWYPFAAFTLWVTDDTCKLFFPNY